MGKLCELHRNFGDRVIAEWNPDAPETVGVAEREFLDLRSRGFMAFRMDGPGQSSPLTEFDVTADRILLIPAIQGGAA